MCGDSFLPIAFTVLSRTVLKMLAHFQKHGRYIPFVVDTKPPKRKVQMIHIVVLHEIRNRVQNIPAILHAVIVLKVVSKHIGADVQRKKIASAFPLCYIPDSTRLKLPSFPAVNYICRTVTPPLRHSKICRV